MVSASPAFVEIGQFEHTQAEILADRPAFLTAFFADFYNIDFLDGKVASQHMVHFSWDVAVHASRRRHMTA